jgi:hypothetical protein
MHNGYPTVLDGNLVDATEVAAHALESNARNTRA